MNTFSNTEKEGEYQSSFDPEKFLFVFRKNLIWMAVAFVFCFSVAYLYLRYTKPQFQSSSILKLNVESEANELGLTTNMQALDLSELSGEIELIKSKLFFTHVIEMVDLNVSYYYYGRYLTDERYENNPFAVSYMLKNPAFYDLPIDLTILDDDTFELSYTFHEQQVSAIYRFGEAISNEYFNFQIDKTKWFIFPDVEGRYYFTINSQEKLIDYFHDNIVVIPENFNAKTIEVSLVDFNKYKARDLIMAIDTLYLEFTKQSKNQALEQKISFLNQQIEETERKLEEFEDYFEGFTINNRTVDLQSDLKETIMQLDALDSARYNLRSRISDLNLVETQLKARDPVLLNAASMENVPEALGANLIAYQELVGERNLKLASYHENTFVIQKLDDKLGEMKKEVLQAIQDFKGSLHGKLKEVERRRTEVEQSFVSLPSMGTEYNKNKRFYGLQEEFLLSLRQSKMALEITKAGTVTDFVILSSASLPSGPVKPKSIIIYGLGFSVAFMFSFVFLLVKYLLHNKITSLKELEKLVRVPILGVVPRFKNHKLPATRLVVEPHSKSILSESLRTIRTNMEFIGNGRGTKFITVTSTVPGEGKTFVAVNLGAVVAFSKQRVCIVDLDMRRPKIHTAFEYQDCSKGMSTLLIGKSKLDQCIIKSPINGLDFVPAGPIPPNPSELILNKEYDVILNELRWRYDMVILDTPPVDLVTDAVLSMKKSDLQIYVTRADYSRREYVKTLEKLSVNNQISNLTIIFNSSEFAGKSYGYYEDSK